MGNEHEPDHNRKPGKKCKRNQDKSSVGIAKVLLHFLKKILHFLILNHNVINLLYFCVLLILKIGKERKVRGKNRSVAAVGFSIRQGEFYNFVKLSNQRPLNLYHETKKN